MIRLDLYVPNHTRASASTESRLHVANVTMAVVCYGAFMQKIRVDWQPRRANNIFFQYMYMQ